MQKDSASASVFRFVSVSLMFVFLLACGGEQPDQQPPSEISKSLPLPLPLAPPGMHVYKDPVTGKFMDKAPVTDKKAIRVLPQGQQQLNHIDGEAEPATVTEPYESVNEGGGILLDLPPPYSETKE